MPDVVHQFRAAAGSRSGSVRHALTRSATPAGTGGSAELRPASVTLPQDAKICVERVSRSHTRAGLPGDPHYLPGVIRYTSPAASSVRYSDPSGPGIAVTLRPQRSPASDWKPVTKGTVAPRVFVKGSQGLK